ncbi:MAG: response regulator [Rhodomicrobium sp.]
MPHILVVDDEPMISMLLADWLEELGYQILGPSRNVKSALSLIEASPPDAAIIDVSLGAENGYPVADCLSKSNIPFVFATGRAEGSLEPRFGPVRILVKPFDFAAVQAIVAEMIGSTTSR